jgi:hypothetical protein
MKSLVKFCLLLLVSVSCIAAPAKTGIRGTVTDTHGVVLPAGLKARVFVHWDSSGADTGLKSNVGISKDISLEIDSHGQFEVELPPGFYDIYVSAFSFSPTCRKIRIKLGGMITLNPKLEVDPLVTKELADRPF